MPSEVAYRPQSCKEGVEALQHAAGRHDAQDGLEDAGHHVDGAVQQLALFDLGGGGAVLFQVQQSAHIVVDLGHVVADDYLVLSAALHDRDDAAHCLEHVVVGFALILEGETKPGNAVDEPHHIFLSSDIFYNVFGQFCVFTHDLPPVYGCVDMR